jgi:REP element-mobilizing transposase RayT
MPYPDLRKGRYSEPGREYLITTVVHKRLPIFCGLTVARACIRELARTAHETDALWLPWVPMPDHFHGLVSLGHSTKLSEVMRRFKGSSAAAINQSRSSSGTVWQPGFHDHALRREESRIAIARYIVADSLRAGLATKASDYPHWDSLWL